jgi:hypothetical protein
MALVSHQNSIEVKDHHRNKSMSKICQDAMTDLLIRWSMYCMDCDTINNQRKHDAKVLGFEFYDMKSDLCITLHPN